MRVDNDQAVTTHSNPTSTLIEVPRSASARERLLVSSRSSPAARLMKVVANLVGAGGAAAFAWAGWHHYESTHSLIGGLFLASQLWVVVAYLMRRPASAVSLRTSDRMLAFGGTFGGVLLRPSGAHPHWGVMTGLDLQLVGLGVWVASFLFLGRSFGFAAADRGLKRRGPYAIPSTLLTSSFSSATCCRVSRSGTCS